VFFIRNIPTIDNKTKNFTFKTAANPKTQTNRKPAECLIDEG